MPSNRLVIVIVFAVVIIGASFIGVWGGNFYSKYRVSKNRQTIAPLILHRMQNVAAGDKVPDFALENLSFEPVNLGQYVKYEKNVLLFMDPTCHSCLDDLDAIFSTLGDGINLDRFILISSGNPRLLRNLHEKYSSKFTVLYDHKGVFSSLFGVNTFPFHLIVDSNMEIISAIPGKLTEDEIRQVIYDQSFGQQLNK